ncbi:MAG: YceD family protein [Bacteroidales bacterium]|nr:YceD family protein [Bacteroidales bacterium]
MFESFGSAEIFDASLNVETAATRTGTRIEVDCRICGNVTTVCDRCLADLEIPVDLSLRLKFGREEDSGEDDGREAVLLEEGETEIDMRQVIYDYVCLSVPLKKVHPEGLCDPEVAGRLTVEETDSPKTAMTDTPFASLKELLKND